MLNLIQRTDESQLSLTKPSPISPLVDKNPSKINDLAKKLADVTFNIKQLQVVKADLEKEIAMIVGVADEGKTSIDTDDFKVSTTGKLTRKITDVAALQAVAPELLREKFELDTRKFKKLAVDNPALFQQIGEYVETKSAKPSISLEFKDADA